MNTQSFPIRESGHSSIDGLIASTVVESLGIPGAIGLIVVVSEEIILPLLKSFD